MANRILRDWTFSENIDLLSYEAESFFTRLIMKADDYGRFHATEKLLKAALYPLRDVPLKTIAKMLTECVNVGVVFCYEVNGKLYLEIPNFGQRLRQMNSRFPEPLTIDRTMLTVDRQPPPEGRKEVEDETEGRKQEDEKPPKGDLTEKEKKFLIWFNEKKELFTGTKGKFKTMTSVDKSNLKKLKQAYPDQNDWMHAFKMMTKAVWVIDNNKVTIDHFLPLGNFQKYLNTEDPERTKPKFKAPWD